MRKRSYGRAGRRAEKIAHLLLLSLGLLATGLLQGHRLGSLNGVLVGTEHAVAPGEVLAVVVLEVAVVHVVVSSAVDNLPIGKGDAVVDRGSPDSHGNEEDEVRELVHGHKVGHDPVRPRLRPGVERVERKGREGAWEDERVVELVHWAVEEVAVQSVVDPIDEEIRNDEENDDRERPIGNRERQVVEVVEFEVHLREALLQAEVHGRIDGRDHKNCNERDNQLALDLTYPRTTTYGQYSIKRRCFEWGSGGFQSCKLTDKWSRSALPRKILPNSSCAAQ